MDITPKKLNSSFILLIAGVIIIGASPVMIKSAHAPGIVTSFYRMSIGAIGLLIPFLYGRYRSEEKLSKIGLLYALLGGLCFGIDMAVWSTGIVKSNATIPTLAANTAPIWAGLGSILIFKDKIEKGFWIGMIVSLSGMVIMLFKEVSQSTGILTGFIHGITAGIFYGMYYLATQKGRKILSTLDFLFISTTTSSIFLVIVMGLLGYNFTGYDQTTNIIFIAYGITVQIGGWWLINYTQGHLKAIVVSSTMLGQPVITALIAFFVLNERHTIYHLIGGVIVITGIYLVHFTRLKSSN